MIVEGFKQIGDWLRARTTQKAEDLTNEQMEDMSKPMLINAVKELQAQLRTSRAETKKKSDTIWKLFLKISYK